VTDKSDVPTRVTKLVNNYKNLEKVLYSHAINNLDVQKVLLNNTNTLRVLTIYNRHFDLDKAFKNIKLPLLTQFSFIDYPREISDVAIAQFTKSCPNLTLINFSGCSKLKDHTFTLLVISLKKISDIIILRNNLISSEFLQSLTGTNLNIRRIELGGNPHEFQTKLKLEGGIEHFCEYFKFKLQVIRLEYCPMIGEEAIKVIARTMGANLRELAVVRNFTEKLAKISDSAFFELSNHCPNLKRLEILYSRRFGDKLGEYLGSGTLQNLEYLDLSNCTIVTSLESLCTGCPNLKEFKLAGDSWIRDLVLRSIAKHKNIRTFHLGHYEHSDCDCKSVVPQDPVFSDYSAQGVQVSSIFKDQQNFSALETLYLEKNCEMTKFLTQMIGKYRPELRIRFNRNFSALTY